MQQYPLIVGGTKGIESLLMEDNNIIAKSGFKGIFAFGLRKEGLGFAIKVADGADGKWAPIVASILEQIEYENKETIARLHLHFPRTVMSDNGFIVGEQKAVFRLKVLS